MKWMLSYSLHQFSEQWVGILITSNDKLYALKYHYELTKLHLFDIAMYITVAVIIIIIFC